MTESRGLMTRLAEAQATLDDDLVAQLVARLGENSLAVRIDAGDGHAAVEVPLSDMQLKRLGRVDLSENGLFWRRVAQAVQLCPEPGNAARYHHRLFFWLEDGGANDMWWVVHVVVDPNRGSQSDYRTTLAALLDLDLAAVTLYEADQFPEGVGAYLGRHQ